MLASKQAKSVFLLAAVAAAASSSASAAEDIVWSTSGGGWRSMVAQSAYAQVFSNLGILDTKEEASSDNDIDRPRIRVMAGASGSGWFMAQFAFSENYYKAVVDGTPASLAQF